MPAHVSSYLSRPLLAVPVMVFLLLRDYRVIEVEDEQPFLPFGRPATPAYPLNEEVGGLATTGKDKVLEVGDVDPLVCYPAGYKHRHLAVPEILPHLVAPTALVTAGEELTAQPEGQLDAMLQAVN